MIEIININKKFNKNFIFFLIEYIPLQKTNIESSIL